MLVQIASIFALAAAGPPAAGIQLNLKPGDVLTYRTTYESRSLNQGKETGSKTTETKRYEVLSETDGWFHVRETTVESKRETTSGTALAYDTTGLVVTFDVYRALLMRNWQLVDAGRLGEEEGRRLSSNAKSTESRGFMGLVLPGGDLKVGTRWEHRTIPSATSFSGSDVSITKDTLTVAYKVVKFENYRRERHAVIEARIDGKYEQTLDRVIKIVTKVKEKRKYWLNVSNGVVSKVESELDSSMNISGTVIASVTSTKTELVSD
ncbi:MAG: hypothetical protein IIC73_02280 [Armatimonadetes bacterium]|nr:hypothetical protein [Armatimonadota bacterium]